MSLSSMLFLAVVFPPSLLAIKVVFENGDFAEYNLLQVKNKGSVNFLQGGQGFVRFAKVVSSPPRYPFKVGDEVALKIGYEKNELDMRREQKAHDFIRKNTQKGFIEGVVRVEKSLGMSLDLGKDKNLVLPEGKEIEGKYFILVMETLGKNMASMYDHLKGFSETEIEKVHDSLNIKLIHGDVKPENILFYKSNKIEDGVKLADFGLAIFEGSTTVRCGGDLLYISPIQYSIYRPATFDDIDVSFAYSILHVGTGNLPWLVFYKDLLRPESYRDLHYERIQVAKHEFNLNPFKTSPGNMQLSQALKINIMKTIEEATSHEVAIVQGQIDARLQGNHTRL